MTKFWSEHFPDILALPSGKHAVSLSASSAPCDRRQALAKPAHPHQHVLPDASGTKLPMTPRPLTRPFTAEALLGLRGREAEVGVGWVEVNMFCLWVMHALAGSVVRTYI